MAEAARDALEQPTLNVVADAGYSNGAQTKALAIVRGELLGENTPLTDFRTVSVSVRRLVREP